MSSCSSLYLGEVAKPSGLRQALAYHILPETCWSTGWSSTLCQQQILSAPVRACCQLSHMQDTCKSELFQDPGAPGSAAPSASCYQYRRGLLLCRTNALPPMLEAHFCFALHKAQAWRAAGVLFAFLLLPALASSQQLASNQRRLHAQQTSLPFPSGRNLPDASG